jgi:hypothetical protein
MQTNRGKSGAGGTGQRRVELDAGDIVGANPVVQQRGVITGAGTDFQHPMSGLQIKRFEHAGHDHRLRTGAGRGTSTIYRVHVLHEEYLVGVDLAQPLLDLIGIRPVKARHKHLTGHVGERLSQPWAVPARTSPRGK